VQDLEVKFGYAVTGEVDPSRILANGGARPGDVLLLTKAIGTGVIATALKFGRAPEAAVTAAVRSMTTLNRIAAEVVSGHGTSVHACTDITGFGLLGHASEMAIASRCSLEMTAGLVPLIEGALPLVRGNIPGGGRTNREHFSPGVQVAADIDGDLMDLLYDPQTSGGLLLAVARDVAAELERDLRSAGVPVARVGHALAHSGTAIAVV
jgi:selenide,water dikinase